MQRPDQEGVSDCPVKLLKKLSLSLTLLQSKPMGKKQSIVQLVIPNCPKPNCPFLRAYEIEK